MPTISTLTVDVAARTSRFRTGLRVVNSGLFALAGAAAFAFKEFQDAEKISKQTAAAIKSTGGAAHVTANQVEDLSQALSEKTSIDDEAIQSAENLLLTFRDIRNEVGKGNDIFNQATSAVLDMSTALDQDFKSSAIQLGKALNDPIVGLTALRRVGVAFTESQVEMIKGLVESGDKLKAQKIILAEINKEFGGSAKAQRTATSAMIVSLGNLAEAIGGLLAPAVNRLLGLLTHFVQFLQANLGPALRAARDWLTRVWERVKPLATAFGRELWNAAQKVWVIVSTQLWPTLRRLWNDLQPLIVRIGKLGGALMVIAVRVMPVIVQTISNAIFVIEKLISTVQRAIDGLSELAKHIPGGGIGGAVAKGFLQNLLGPIGLLGHAEGGHMRAWEPGIVGEKGPELFVPDVAGTVIPNGELGAPGPIYVTVMLGDESLGTAVAKGLRHRLAKL